MDDVRVASLFDDDNADDDADGRRQRGRRNVMKNKLNEREQQNRFETQMIGGGANYKFNEIKNKSSVDWMDWALDGFHSGADAQFTLNDHKFATKKTFK